MSWCNIKLIEILEHEKQIHVEMVADINGPQKIIKTAYKNSERST